MIAQVSPQDRRSESCVALTCKAGPAVVSEIAKGIFDSTATYVLDNATSLAYHVVHLSYPTLIPLLTYNGYLLSSYALLLKSCAIDNFGWSKSNARETKAKTKTEIAFKLIQLAASTALVADIALSSLLIRRLEIQLLIKTIVLTAGLISNLRSIGQGASKIYSACNERDLSTRKRVHQLSSGLLSVGLGVLGSGFTMRAANSLYRGFQVYQTLDASQQMFVLKHNALESLGNSKTQRAVIIDGMSNKWGESKNYHFDEVPDPESMVIYQNYNTRAYRVDSSASLANVLGRAKKDLGGSIDLISFVGHANSSSMTLNEDYAFSGTATELRAMAGTMSHRGQVLLLGCDTARETWLSRSLTQRISSYLSDKLVMGFGDLRYPSLTYAWFDGKIRSYSFHQGNVFTSIVRLFRNGIEVV